jgi:hypothetical protein
MSKLPKKSKQPLPPINWDDEFPDFDDDDDELVVNVFVPRISYTHFDDDEDIFPDYENY